MKIILDGDLKYEIPEFYIQTFSLLFFPEDHIFGKNGAGENYIKIFINKNKKIENLVDISVNICYNKKTVSKSENKIKNNDLIIDTGKIFYKTAGEITGYYPPWGMHTGIRPAKTAGEILEKNHFNETKTLDILCDDYLMEKNKAALAIEIYKNGKCAVERVVGANCVRPMDQNASLAGEHSSPLQTNDFSLYISIPFCPTRCKYCSFVSFATPGLLKLIPVYVKKLIEEIELISVITKNMTLKTIYIGGGTPTTLDGGSLEMILNAVKNHYDLSHLIEYTVECGRADTITKEKLELLKSFDVDRISVNPQTLNDDILQKIGRNHTAGDFFKAFEIARKTGIKNINTDCIIGLGNERTSFIESCASMINTIKTLADLKPENITVHSLCIKKSAELKSKKIYTPNAPELNIVLEKYYDILKTAGYKPYYMYRQKYTAGNLENTGFCLDHCECLYNIYMMDELQTIFGVGAGSMTKLVKDGRIERIANYKYPYEYIERDFQINREINRDKLMMLENV